MEAYKLLSLRRDGSIGPLFINRRLRIPLGVELHAECHPTKGFAVRPGWHCTKDPVAPHLSKKGRVWCRVRIEDYYPFQRPQQQGGTWYLANKMTVLEVCHGLA